MEKPSAFQISCLSLFSIIALALTSPGCTKTDALGAAGQDDSSVGGNAPIASGGVAGTGGANASGGATGTTGGTTSSTAGTPGATGGSAGTTGGPGGGGIMVTSSAGGVISQGGSADAGQDASNLVPNICPSVAPGTGAPCASAGETCAYDGCTACVCMSNGTWECTSGPGDCASCPTTVTAGSPCTSNGLICLSWAFCGSECSCDGTTWSCALCGGGACGGSPCSSSPSCPATLPNDGQTCGALGNSCLYGWPAGCVKATCSCSVAGWSCSYGSYCLDAGE